VSVTIKNTGNRAGDEVVQVYVKHLNSAVARPQKELRGFKRVAVMPGESRVVEIPLKAESLAYWNVQKHSFVVEPEQVQVMVGASSADIRLQDQLRVVE
jgi:beta-glucosidase